MSRSQDRADSRSWGRLKSRRIEHPRNNSFANHSHPITGQGSPRMHERMW